MEAFLLCRTNLTAAELAETEHNLWPLAESRGGKSGLYLSGFKFIFVQNCMCIYEKVVAFSLPFGILPEIFFLKKNGC